MNQKYSGIFVAFIAAGAVLLAGCSASHGPRAAVAPMPPGPPSGRAYIPAVRVTDGTIVLVKKGKAYGAVILKRQRPGFDGPPEVAPGPVVSPRSRVEYDWYYRTDGKGTFSRQERGDYKSGHDCVAKHVRMSPFRNIRFGPFWLDWGCSWNSSSKNGHCELYYNMPDLPKGQLMCVTAEKNIEKIDAADAKWTYKSCLGQPFSRSNSADGGRAEVH